MTPTMPARTTISATCSTTNTGAKKPSSIGSRPAASIRSSPFPGAISGWLTTTCAGNQTARPNATKRRAARTLRTRACSTNSINFGREPPRNRGYAWLSLRGAGTSSTSGTISRSNWLRSTTSPARVPELCRSSSHAVSTGQSARALSILLARRFHPWEGGEGLVSAQYVSAHILLGADALGCNNAADALSHFEAARQYPHNLGEGKHLLTRETHVDYFSGLALSLARRAGEASGLWRKAANTRSDTDMFAYYRALALRSLGDDAGAVALLRHLHEFAEAQMNAEVKIDYFATSLPNFLLFEDDLRKRNRIECLFLRGLANLGLGRHVEAAADLEQVLSMDRTHLFAHLELRRMASFQEATSTP